ncbi:MAG: peptidylprolyl isomerase [Candidatus Hinthialibacter sp.]
MKKTIFSKVFSPEFRRLHRFASLARTSRAALLVLPAVCLLLSACAEKASDLPVIALINDNPVYLNELELLGGLACSEAGLNFNTPAGQEHFKKIAPNLYKTLIDIYVMKYTAEREGFAPTPEEVEAELARFSAKLKDQGVYDEFLSRLKITEKELRETLYDRLAIQKLQKEKLVDMQVEVSDQDVRDFYHQNLKMFRHPSRVRVSHIFIAAPKTDPADKREQARARIEQIRQMIGGEPAKTFAALAREHSQDQVSAVRGGDLGFITQEANLLKGFKTAAFALSEGQVSDVVETEAGYHIIWATDHEQSLDEAFEAIKQMAIQRKKANQYAQWLKKAAEQIDIVKLFDPKEFKVLQEPEGE